MQTKVGPAGPTFLFYGEQHMKRYGLIVLIVLIAGSAWASSRQIRMSLDWSTFHYDEEQYLFELYYSFPQTQLTYTETESGFQAQTMGKIQVFQDDTLFTNYLWKNQNVVPDTATLNPATAVLDEIKLVLPPGSFSCLFVLQDVKQPDNADSAFFRLPLDPRDKNGPALSSLQISNSIRRATEPVDSPFYKNTLIVEPNPSLIFSKDMPMLFFYAEAYHLPNARTENGYNLHYSVTTPDGQPVANIKDKTVNKTQVVHPSVEFGMINVGRLSSGTYLLNVKLLDSKESVIDSRQKKFFIYQPGEVVTEKKLFAEQQQYASSPFAQMDSALIAKEYQYVYYIVSDEEKPVWDETNTLDAQRHFLYNFWAGRDPVPDTFENEYRLEYLRRIEYANQNFRTMGRDGWTTDRGRVYAIYGVPSDIDRHPNEANVHPYTIWNYHNIQDGGEFVFADLDGHGTYELIHSNVLGEIQNYDYMGVLRKGSY
jgi:GWxTD domain-containing protein